LVSKTRRRINLQTRTGIQSKEQGQNDPVNLCTNAPCFLGINRLVIGMTGNQVYCFVNTLQND
jgi:hypothetical protein